MAEGERDSSQALPDWGLLAFVLLLRFLENLLMQLNSSISLRRTVNCLHRSHSARCQALDVKARREQTSSKRLEKASLPAIALLKTAALRCSRVLRQTASFCRTWRPIAQ